MRPADSYHAVGEALQADVMRFLAIVAFCLIAILALVRNAAPAPDPTAPVTAAPVTAPPVAPPVSEPEIVMPEPAPVPAPAAVTQSPLPVPQEPVAEPAAAPDGSEAPAPEVAEAAEAVSAEPADAGLSLRFASDRDFLRLVNRGTISLFAFNGREVLRLGTDLRFQSVAAPGQVHELMPRTIPATLDSVLAGGRNVADYRWGVVLPERLTRAIRRYLDDGAVGELVIDRFGEVRHHEA